MGPRGLVALAVLGFVTGCAGSASGTVAGFGLTVADAVFVEDVDPSGRVRGLTIILSDRLELCEAFRTSSALASATTLSLDLVRDFSAPPSALGTYVLNPSMQVARSGRAFFNRTGSDCASVIPSTAGVFSQGGRVELEALTLGTGGTARGSFEMVFGEDALEGTFTATRCDPPRSPTTLTCK